MSFDTFVVVDWSGASKPSPVGESKDAIWIGIAREGTIEASYHRTRAAATETLAQLFEAERAAGRRVLAGFDFPFAYPKGFAEALTGARTLSRSGRRWRSGSKTRPTMPTTA